MHAHPTDGATPGPIGVEHLLVLIYRDLADSRRRFGVAPAVLARTFRAIEAVRAARRRERRRGSPQSSCS